MPVVSVPTPGPASTTTRVRAQSAWRRMREIRNRLLGTTEPSIRGCRRKARPNRRLEGSGRRCGGMWSLSLGKEAVDRGIPGPRVPQAVWWAGPPIAQ